MPKACPYVMMRFLFVLSDKQISEGWFFAEGERFYPFGDATDLVRGRR